MAGLWYRTGSVAVTQSSKKITGTGTSWLTALNRPSKGNVFYGPDGKAYEIDYISSETELYLVDAYAGAAATGQSYKIDVRGGTVPELSRQLSEHYAYMQGIIDSLQSIVSGSGDVTISGPSGQTVTVPALANMLSKSGNLAGLADKAASRRNLGISEFADSLLDDANAAGMRSTIGLVKQTYLMDTTSGSMMQVGAFGLGAGAKDLPSFISDSPQTTTGSFYRAMAAAGGSPGADVSGICMPFDGVPSQTFLAVARNYGYMWIGRRVNSNAAPIWTRVWTENALPYEVGSFTPSVQGSSTAGAATYSMRMGRYTRIGNRVHFVINVVWTGHTGAGTLQVTIPITSNATAGNAPPVSLLASGLTFSGSLSGLVAGNTNYLIIRESRSGQAYADIPIPAAGTLIISGSYEI